MAGDIEEADVLAGRAQLAGHGLQPGGCATERRRHVDDGDRPGRLLGIRTARASKMFTAEECAVPPPLSTAPGPGSVGRATFLEEVVEAATGVAGRMRRRPRLALDGHPQREQRTGVGRALVGDALGDALRALEPLPGIEVGALGAGVQAAPQWGHRLSEPVAMGRTVATARAAGDGPALQRARGRRGGVRIAPCRLRARGVPVAALAVAPILHAASLPQGAAKSGGPAMGLEHPSALL